MAEQYVNTIIGPGSTVRGDLEIDGLVRIDGDFIGTIRRASRVLVGNQGRADAVINAKVVVVGGAFHGTIYASERIVFLSTSLVMGQVQGPRILVEPGALLSCSLSIQGEKEALRDDLLVYRARDGAGEEDAPRPRKGLLGREKTRV